MSPLYFIKLGSVWVAPGWKKPIEILVDPLDWVVSGDEWKVTVTHNFGRNEHPAMEARVGSTGEKVFIGRAVKVSNNEMDYFVSALPSIPLVLRLSP